MQKIEKYIHHPLVKKLGANFAWLSILQATSYLFPLITIPYIARVVGTWGYGKIAFASAVIVWFQTITDWGFQYTSTRDVARVREDKLKVSQKYSNTLWARIILMFCAAAILLVLTLLIPKFRENWLVLLSTFLLIPGHILCPDWFFQALERMKYITILNICAKLIFTVCIFIFIHERNQYFLQPLFISLGYIVTGFISIYIIVVKWGYRIQKPNFAEIFEEIKSSADVFINNVVPNFYNSFSVILLGFYCGPTANGLLDVGNKFTSIGQQINILISRTFFPTLSRNIQYHKYFTWIQIGTAIIMALFLVICAPFLIRIFYTAEFEPAIPAVRLLGLSLIFMSLSNTFGTNWMIIEGHARILRNITLIVSLIGFGLSFLLIVNYGFIGATLTIVICRCLLGSVISLKALRLKHIQRHNAHEAL